MYWHNFVRFAVPLFMFIQAFSQTLDHTEPEKVGLSSNRLDVITRLMENEVNRGEIAGAVTLIARRGKIAYLQSAGFKDLETQRPMTDDAVFRTMSISKVFTSLAVMILQEEGKLLIYEPISKYIPAWANQMILVDPQNSFDVEAADREVTIHDMLTHMAGTPYLDTSLNSTAGQLYGQENLGGFDIMGNDETIGEYVARLAVLPKMEHPGEQWQYGWATDVLGYLVEVVSGQPLDVFLQERIFAPLGMGDTHFWLPEEKLDRFTSVYIQNNGRGNGISLFEAYDDNDWVGGPKKLLSGAGGVLSTVDDLAVFCQMILNNGKHKGRRIISAKSLEAMTENQIGDDMIEPFFRFWGNKFGLGFGIRTEAGPNKDIETTGTLSFSGVYFPKFWIDPAEDMTVIFFTQLLPTAESDYRGIAAQIKIAAWSAIDDDLAPKIFKQ